MALVNTHAQKASESQYDRSVCILAISTAREQILSIPSDFSSEYFQARVQDKLNVLANNYHDADGEYTSGKGVIVALLDDIRLSAHKQI